MIQIQNQMVPFFIFIQQTKMQTFFRENLATLYNNTRFIKKCYHSSVEFKQVEFKKNYLH